MNNYIVMYSNKGMLYMFYVNSSSEDNVFSIATKFLEGDFIFKQTFLTAEQYIRDQNYIYEDMMNDFCDIYDLPSN